MSENNNYPFTWENTEEGTVITLVEQITESRKNEDSVTSSELESALGSIGLSSDASGLVYNLMVNGKNAGTINIPQDQFLKNVDYNQEEKKLIFTFNTENENGETIVEVSVADLVDIYSAGNGVSIEENKVSIIVSPNSQKYIEIDETGIKIVGIDEALAQKADKSDLEGLASEQWVEEKNYLTEVPETFATDEEVLKAVSEYAKTADVEANYQPKGDYALKNEIPSKASQLENDVPYLTEHQDISGLASKEELVAEVDRALSAESEIIANLETKANIGDSYTKAESDNKFLTEHQDISMFATSDELIAEIGRATAKENEIESGYKAADEVIMTEVAKKVAEVKLEKVNDLQYQLLVDGNVAGNVNIPEDQFLKSVEYVASSNDLVFIFKTENGENTVSVNIADLVDTYTAGNGLSVSDNNFIVVIDPSSESYLYVSENGIRVSGIDAKLAEKEDKGVAYSKEESDAKFLTEHQDLSNLATKEEIVDVVKYQHSTSEDKKIILLDNSDLIMGKVNPNSEIQPDPSASALTLIHLNEWNIVDVGSPKTITNINVHAGYRPTVQESGQSGEEAHQIAYVSDIKALLERIEALEARIVVLENRVYTGNDLVNLIENIKEGETVNIEVYNDVLISNEEPIFIPKDSTMNLNLNGNTVTYQDKDVLFRVNGTLNISGGNMVGDGYVASANAGGVINVSDGFYKTDVTCLQCNGGIVNISGGTYDSYTEQYGRVYTLNHIDSKKNEGKISVTGGTFVGYNPADSHSEYPAMSFVAEGYESIPVLVEGVECYTVVKKTEVSSGDEIVEAITNMKDGEVLALNVNSDIVMANAEPVSIGESSVVSINLNGNKFTNPISEKASIINNGELVIIDGDFVNGMKEAQGSDVIENNGVLTINGGNIGSYENRGAAVRNFGLCTVNGGNFLSLEKGATNDDGYAYVFINAAEDAVMNINNAHVEGNVHGVFASNAGTINVNGGYYKIGENGKQTYYIAYTSGNGVINLNGGEYYWTKGAANVSTYGNVNIAEGVVINETR